MRSCVTLVVLIAAQVSPIVAGDQSSLLSKLSEETIWTEFEQRHSLVALLELVAKNPNDDVITALVDHLGYDIYSFRRLRPKLVAIDKQHPVMKTLENIGLPAVPALVNVLTSSDIENRPDGVVRDPYLALMCLEEIYGRGGYGRELAVERLKLEVRHARGEQKERLLKVLRHPILAPMPWETAEE